MADATLTIIKHESGGFTLRSSAPVSAGKGKGHRFKLYEARAQDVLTLNTLVELWRQDHDAFMRFCGWTPSVDPKSGKQIATDIGDLGL